MNRALLTVAAVVLAFFVARLTVATESASQEQIRPTQTRTERVAYTTAAPSIAHEEATAPEPTHTQEPAQNLAQQAHLVVDRALASGQWKSTDRMELDAMLGQLSQADADAVLSKLFTSINAGRLALESTPL
jgi:hypothetical protein